LKAIIFSVKLKKHSKGAEFRRQQEKGDFVIPAKAEIFKGDIIFQL
jgi:hypothetical protein